MYRRLNPKPDSFDIDQVGAARVAAPLYFLPVWNHSTLLAPRAA